MRFRLRAGWWLTLLFVSFAAVAQSDYVEIEKRLTPEQRHATGLDTLSPEQLALLNALLRESETKSIADAEQAARAEARVEASAEAKASAPATDPGAGRFIGLNDEPIRSRLKGEVSGWEPGYVFELENGQQWKVLKGKMKLYKPLQAPEILVVPGIAGRWFLQVHEDMPKARVYRID